MRINPITINFLHTSTTSNFVDQNCNIYKTKNYPCDSVTFSSKPDSEIQKNNLVDALEVIGFVGTPVVSSILIGTELMKHSPQDDKIFLSDGTYFCDVNELTLKSDKVFADADDGILKIKDSPIDIDASKVDYADPIRGIYKNFDGSVDIDLLHQKYIDTNNGIYVDVQNGISKIIENGEIKELPLINFEGSSMSGWNHPSTPYHLDSDIINNGIVPSVIDDIKKTINMLFGTHIPTGYIVDNNGDRIPMREWIKEHDALNRDFETPENSSTFKDYVQDHNLPISVNEDGQVIPINENSDDSDNVIDSNHTDYDYGNYLDNLDNDDYDNQDFD